MSNGRSVLSRCAPAAAAVAMLAAGVAFGAGGHGHGHDQGHGHGYEERHGHQEGHGHEEDHGHGAAIGAPGTAAEVDRSVEIEAGDLYFKPDSLKVSAGETVRFVVHNKGRLLHEFNLGTPAMHHAHQEEMREMMDHGMLTATGIAHREGHGGMRHDDPNSVLIEPGATRELIWTFSESGELQFACNVPGHYPAGMHGRIAIDQ